MSVFKAQRFILCISLLGASLAHGQEGSGWEDPEALLRTALEQFDGGDAEQAARTVDDYLSTHPNSYDVAVSYSRELGSRRAFDASIAYLRQHLIAHPDNQFAALEVGVLLLALLRYGEAAEYFQMVPLDLGMTSSMAQLNLGKALRALGRFEEAGVVYTGQLTTASAVFAESALCQIDLSLGDLEACRTRLVSAVERFGAHPALDQAGAFLAYHDADFGRAQQLLASIRAVGGRANPRVQTLTILVALADGRIDEAQRLAEDLRHVTLLGERQALLALVAQRAGRLDSASAQYAAAVERNPTFERPNQVGPILLWRPDLTATLQEVSSQSSEPEDLPAEGSGTNHTTGAPEASHSQDGCCSVANTQPRWHLLMLLLLLIVVRRRQSVRSSQSSSSPKST